ncbi:hypothetical protein I316_00252 [Kwoniella heveanensis BCC8398]|uniref:Uncharacterized protein n=1 Tax=Kwoniella heveanensis BCC8398 TaxID=1296120 RepID=A0A1B9H443_9TREE|nr:hypothetical protein I316_00252 [Kwoniella heveanensis BCC8398]
MSADNQNQNNNQSNNNGDQNNPTEGGDNQNIVTLDDADSNWTYGGDTWGTNHTDDPMTPQYSEGTFHTTTVHQAWAQLCWTGQDITIFGAKRSNHGLYATVVDNGEIVWGDGFSEKPQIQAVLFASQGLEWGDHQVVISNQNKVNVTKNRIWFDVDHATFTGWPIDCNSLPEASVTPSGTIAPAIAPTPATNGESNSTDPSSATDGSATLFNATSTAPLNSTSAPLSGISTLSSTVSPTTTVTLSSSSSSSAAATTSAGAVAGSDSGAGRSVAFDGQLALFGMLAFYLFKRLI